LPITLKTGIREEKFNTTLNTRNLPLDWLQQNKQVVIIVEAFFLLLFLC